MVCVCVALSSAWPQETFVPIQRNAHKRHPDQEGRGPHSEAKRPLAAIEGNGLEGSPAHLDDGHLGVSYEDL